ncbi:MAG: hypothetical protein WDN28_24680 [Chthoniobacter sp.]
MRFEADTITLGARRLAVDQYDDLDLSASKGLFLFGNGRLTTEGNFTAETPFITAAGPATQKIVAGGSLQILKPKGVVTPDRAGALGASLSLQGTSVTATSDVLLPSGLFSARATTGDVVVGGDINVSGTARSFFDVIKYTDGGKISLSSDRGSVNVNKRATLSVGALAGGGSGGSLSISAAKGEVNLLGSLYAKGGLNGTDGSFSLDVGQLPQFGKLNDVLDAGYFTESRSFRVRDGDVFVGGKSIARHFDLSADAGSITVSGTIDASGQTGGSIELSANGSLTLLNGSQLTVAGKDFDAAGKGGAISLEAGAQRNGVYDNSGTLDGDGSYDSGAILDIREGSEIDLSVASNTAASSAQGRFSGTLHLRAPRTASGTEVQINPIDGLIRGASSIIVEGYKIYDLNPSLVPDAAGLITTAIKNLIKADAVNFVGTAGTPSTPELRRLAMPRCWPACLEPANAGLDPVLSIRPRRGAHRSQRKHHSRHQQRLGRQRLEFANLPVRAQERAWRADYAGEGQSDFSECPQRWLRRG